VQRTTAKEQDRRLVAAVLPDDIIRRHGAVVIENHVNVIRTVEPTRVECRDLLTRSMVAAILNSRVADQIFRCISGSVAVSAYEIESLPVPDPDGMRALSELLERDASADEINQTLAAAYQGHVGQLA
jgi:adenine-specific DNA-methyltransferase